MRTKFAVSAAGNILFSDGKTEKKHVIAAERRGHAVRIEIKEKCTAEALVTLLYQLRNVRCDIVVTKPFHGQTKTRPLSASDACLYLGQFALKLYEEAYHDYFSSSLAFWPDNPEKTQHLPLSMHTIASKYVQHLDTATALTHFNEDEMRDAAFIYPDSDQHPCISKLPHNPIWPDILENGSKHKIATALPHPYGFWLVLVTATALTTRRTILHSGQFKIDAADSQSHSEFARLLTPLAAMKEKPANYRLISLAYRLTDEAPIL